MFNTGFMQMLSLYYQVGDKTYISGSRPQVIYIFPNALEYPQVKCLFLEAEALQGKKKKRQ